VPLYKFIERKYLYSFFSNGELRLGTIHGYRDTIEYGSVRGDSSEGRHSVIRTVDDVRVTDNSEPIVSEVFRVAEGGSFRLVNMNLVVQRQSSDAFIFCTSHLYSEQLFLEWHKQEQLDACCEITIPQGFVDAITRKIESSAWYARTSPVAYFNEHIDYRSPSANLPGLTKSQKYEWQHETRSIWPPRLPSPPLQPWGIHVPDAVQFCKPFAVLENSSIRYLK